MKTKYLVLAALALADIPLYLALFRLLFRGTAGRGRLPTGLGAEADDAVPGTVPEKPRLSDFLDPDFIHDGGGGSKLFLFVLAALLILAIEYYGLLSIFPALAQSVVGLAGTSPLPGIQACLAAISS